MKIEYTYKYKGIVLFNLTGMNFWTNKESTIYYPCALDRKNIADDWYHCWIKDYSQKEDQAEIINAIITLTLAPKATLNTTKNAAVVFDRIDFENPQKCIEFVNKLQKART